MMRRKAGLSFRRANIRYLRRRRLRQDSSNRLAPLGNMNFADFSSFADPFAGVVVELANANRLHVTHGVT